jgi:hypothetical protein
MCHKVIEVEACVRKPNDPGDHDVAYHVAQSYHFAKEGRCVSCSEAWPCPTIEVYG